MLIAYVDHPIGETNGHDSIKRADNLAAAGDWICYVAEITQWTILAPWYVYAVKHIKASRRIVDTTLALERCDLYVPTGGIMSPHMRNLHTHARRKGIPVLDLTSHGVLPPDKDDENATQIIMAKCRRVLAAPRRVWMPLLLESDVEALKKLAHAARVHMPDEHDIGAGVVERIITAAESVRP